MQTETAPAAVLFNDYFKPADCTGCGKRRRCYTDPETGCPLCLACIELACEAAANGLTTASLAADLMHGPDFPTPDAGNGHSDRTNPALRTIGTR